MADAGSAGDVIHKLKNHVAIVLGFTELLIADTPESDHRYRDLVEIHKAAQAAMALMPDVDRRLRGAVAEEAR